MDILFESAEPMLYEISNRSTMYRLTKVASGAAPGEAFYLLQSGWGGNYGEWIRLGTNEISWDYLAEKMPVMAQREGDKEGWVKVFAMAGVTVFH